MSSTGPQHGRAARTPRSTAVVRAVAVIVAVLGVVGAATLTGRGAPDPTVEPPIAEHSTAPQSSPARPSTAPPAPATATTRTPSASPRATASPPPTRATAPPATRSSRPPASPTHTPKPTTKAKARPEPTHKATSPKPTIKAESAPQSLVDEIVTRTNAERTRAGLPALRVSSCAAGQAASRTKVLVAEDRFEHDPLDPVVKACGTGTVGENLALGYPTAKAVVAGWMGSAGHKANILGEQYTKIGVGCTKGPKGQLCAQVFLG